jgi:hypothetical protein
MGPVGEPRNCLLSASIHGLRSAQRGQTMSFRPSCRASLCGSSVLSESVVDHDYNNKKRVT